MTGRRLALGVVAVAAGAPMYMSRHTTAGAAQGLALLLAANGLNLAVGYVGQPSLGQGGFVAIGAYGTAMLIVHAGWDPVSAAFAGVLLATAAGVAIGSGVARMRPAFVAVTTWLATWMLLYAVSAFPRLSGGAGGLTLGVVKLRLRSWGTNLVMGPAWWYEIALLGVVLSLGVTAIVERRFGGALAATVADAGAARAAGIPVPRLRAGMLAASAAIGGLAGCLIVLGTGIADPTAYGPVLSVKLFIVVLLGGAGRLYGPAAGIVALVVVTRVAEWFGAAVGSNVTSVEPFVAAAVLALVLVVGRRGIVPLVESMRKRLPGSASEPVVTPALSFNGARLSVRDLSVSFGGVSALDGCSFAVAAGSCHGIVGPNGSGKSTFLRVIGGAITADAGTIEIDGVVMAPSGPEVRTRLGVARTLQRTTTPPDATTLMYVASGFEHRRRAGAVAAIAHTPGARRESAMVARDARAVLSMVGLEDAPVGSLTGAEQRLLNVARALASGPRVMLLDEPSAGMSLTEQRRLAGVIRSVRDSGLTVVVVEHNLRFLAAVADRVTVLDAGGVVAEGTAAEVAVNAGVIEAYLGSGTATMAAHAADDFGSDPRARDGVRRGSGTGGRQERPHRGQRSAGAIRRAGSANRARRRARG